MDCSYLNSAENQYLYPSKQSLKGVMQKLQELQVGRFFVWDQKVCGTSYFYNFRWTAVKLGTYDQLHLYVNVPNVLFVLIGL